MSKCAICGSDRILEGPAYDPNATQCMDCGSQFNRTEKIAVESPLPELPEGGFANIEEAMAHLEKLKAAKKNKFEETKVDRPSKKHPTSDYPAELTMAVLHYYQRQGETFQAVLAVAKGERAYKNENILIWAHGHNYRKQCTSTCREILSENS